MEKNEDKVTIEVKKIHKVYNTGTETYTALHQISFSIEEGEFVAIMGPSGSGKSTIMHILGCLDTPSSGTYILDGKDVSTMTDDELAEIRKNKIGFVFQSFNLLPRTTVLRNVVLPLVYAGVPPEERTKRAAKALVASGLTKEYFNHLSNQLSGGQIQRVAIARALVNDPALVLADEPTGNLDSKTSLIVLGTLQKLNREQGRTIILITHEPDIAEHADRIIRIRDGSVVSDEKNRKVRDATKESVLYEDEHTHEKS
ncbi:MAG: ABC transporter ATP-binding protein [Candidatus Kaiserbacteria bacterium]|nr:ABC transporter ATP-binding protein [Candidatus Kaiserbacteria bacterium]